MKQEDINTRDSADFKEVIHNYSTFDFTKVPLLESEDDFQEYHKAFMKKYGRHPLVRSILGENIEESVIKEGVQAMGKRHMMHVIGSYNFVAMEMGHFLLGEDEDDIYDDAD